MTGDPARIYTATAVRALSAALASETDFAGWLAGVLCQVAADAGSVDTLTRGRPGSWESSLLDQLARGTAGLDGEFLPAPGSSSRIGE